MLKKLYINIRGGLMDKKSKIISIHSIFFVMFTTIFNIIINFHKFYGNRKIFKKMKLEQRKRIIIIIINNNNNIVLK